MTKIKQLRLTLYLAGSSKEIKYRNYVIKKYWNDFLFLNPLNISREESLEQIGHNEHNTFLVRRDKKMILQSDIVIVYIGESGKPSWGTAMEIMFAYEHGIPVYVIDESIDKQSNDVWIKFHAKKIFSGIDECFNWLLSDNKVGLKVSFIRTHKPTI